MMFADIEEFLEELEIFKEEFLPDAKIETNYKRVDKVSIRIEISAVFFVDIYANTENERYDFSIVKDGKRVFGYDNLQSWHYHPLTNPDDHIECEEPSFRSIFQEITAIIVSL